MKNLSKRLKGYQRLTRNRHVLSKNLALTDQEYRLWDLCIALYDWDPKHTDTFGTLEATDRQISGLLDWSYAKVCRTRNSLIKKGLILKVERGIYSLTVSSVSGTQQDIASSTQEFAQGELKVSPMQQEQAQMPHPPFVSSKVDLVSSTSISDDDKQWIKEDLEVSQ